ncbi:polyketide synthase [Pedobacter sp. Leaf170]|uniref:polyketide synthase n=1 Tax=Pedobacter sp. Leaf170 TaxID=2876558 RepID=UPI001E3F205F|nr:polyketide synthase [Pedobacter sp. Leaf170]
MSNKNTIIDLFTEQTEIYPDRIAIVFEDIQINYKDLDLLTNQIANHLISIGVTEKSLVPICLNKSVDMAIAILAVLKSGAAYIPIDPEFPIERVEFMLEDSGADVVISDNHSDHFFSAAKGKVIINPSDNWTESLMFSNSLPALNAQADNLAYVIYTSGSTGKPKGVLIEHRNLLDYFEGLENSLSLSACNSFAIGATLATDLGNTVLFGSLLYGKTLHLFTKEKFNDVDYIHQYFKNNEIDFLKIVPSHWKSLSLKRFELLPKKILMFGGEALYTALIKDIIIDADRTYQIVNHYGPTETTIGKLIHIVKRETEYGHIVPIGKAFTDARLHILDENGALVKEGMQGELHIGGSGLARGYLNRPDLTQERFIADLFSYDGNERLYKTGDIVKRLADGNIEYLGRTDDQIKIRGYRIELGEIESTLQKAPGVKQGVVLARDTQLGDKRLIGYVVVDGKYDKKEIISFLERSLPTFMVPQLLVQLQEIPLTLNGKIDKKALPDPDASTLLTNPYHAPNYETETNIANVWKELLVVERVGVDDNFFELGGNSLLAQKCVAILKERFGLTLGVTKIYQFPKIVDLAAFLDGRDLSRKLKRKIIKRENTDVAIIGMSGRFPGADSIDELWKNLKEGRETTRFFKDDELDASVPESLKNDPDYIKARGIIDNIADFDATFFGINPKLAELMDPQQRVFLEIAWEALEKTGYIPDKYAGRIGVFAGVRVNTYYANNVISNTELIQNAGKFQVVTVNDKDYVATRTAYTLNLTGPAVNVQSACSTSLLAVAQAVQSIRSGQCEMALAGGATINSPVNVGHLYEEGAMLSNDGHCRPFDSGAEGTVFSDGAGVVLLKDKEEAIKDGDFIFGVIKGIGINNDGGNKASFTAPSAEGQAAAISMAIEDGNINPADISYIETHGTATPLGDPIEIEGLNLAFGPQDKKQYCAIGSVKSNFGHLTCAAGVTGLIKASLALHHKQIPASINYKTPNPNIDFENSPFIVNAELNNWESDKRRIAGVSSFGVGGTNVHIVLEEFENVVQTSTAAKPLQLITWSAKNENSLNGYSYSLSKYLKQAKDVSFADIAYTLNGSRHNFNHKTFAIAGNAEDVIKQIDNLSGLVSPSKKSLKNIREVVFMFPGQGSQFLNMGRALYEHEPVFKNSMDECNALLKHQIGEDLLAIIYPEEINELSESKIKNTRYSQPALFMVSYSIAKLWMSWGVFPTAFIGHSIGEFVAAYFSGILNLQDALKIISTRGKLMSELPGGTMLSVRAKIDEIEKILPERVSIAAINSADLLVLAGDNCSIELFSEKLNQLEIPNKQLQTSHAFHSYMMDAVVEPFKLSLKEINLNKPSIPIYSTVTGTILTDENALDICYWSNHLRATVNFDKAAAQLLQENSEKAFVEIGPGNATSTFIRQQNLGKNCTIITSLDFPKTDQTAYHSILKAVGNLWLSGFDFKWELFYQNQQRIKVYDIPTYSFNKTRYWVEPMQNTYQPVNAISPFTPNIILEQNKPQPVMRKQALIKQLKEILEDASGIEMNDATPEMTFIEIGLDSLLLTQVALILKKKFSLPITFRQLNEEFGTLDLLTDYLDANLPADAISVAPVSQQSQNISNFSPSNSGQPISTNTAINGSALDLIGQQLQLLGMQISLLQGGTQNQIIQNNNQPSITPQLSNLVASAVPKASSDLTPEEEIEIKKPFGAAARIDKQSAALSDAQAKYLTDLTKRYNEKTKGSKAYTQQHRPHMADPRVVSGFKPATKELVYSIVINKSKGSRVWDIDGNEYIDALNGFGSNMLGYQPDFIKNALIEQIEKGYEIGPQHELAGEVSKLICEFTNFDRAGLCNTGSEAVLGAMRIARTVTGRSTIVAFTGSYHGITDEVIVRGSKKLKTFPAAPGIMPEAVQNMLILDYGTEESLKIIEERANDIAAVLVEPVQSRRADFQPIDFLKKLRKITEESETVLIFDEVISGFRFHPAGVQGLFGIQADLGTYGKVAGGGISIGIIAGKKKYMDALDGGFWQFGDDSIPEVGVTYFAGTFVRHPLALATAKASLNYLKEMGPQLQENLNANGLYIANTVNALCRRLSVPMYVAQFGSLWRIKFIEEYPYTELFFTLMRLKGIHVLEGFACFLTTAHTNSDINQIVKCFEESLIELKEVGFIPEYKHPDENNFLDDLNQPPAPNARLGKDKDGNPAWFVKDEANPGKYLQVN